MGKLQVIVGGQAGSEAKGATAAYLAREMGDGLAVRVAGPNAGHVAIDERGQRWALRQVPVAAVTNPDANLAIAAGSEVDPDVLLREIAELEAGGHLVQHRLTIDPQATVIEPHHREAELDADLVHRIGSTGKGIGAARAARIMRAARTVGQYTRGDARIANVAEIGDVSSMARDVLRHGDTVQIEGTQGYQLGLHTANYPQTTSSDCRAIDFMAMAGVYPWADWVDELEIWVVLRAYPIRVAGNSGPLRDETTWENLGLPQERTTVTQKVRRVGDWNGAWAREAIQANGGASSSAIRVTLSMLDQVEPALAGATDPAALAEHSTATDFLNRVIGEIGVIPSLIGTSDRTVLDLRSDEALAAALGYRPAGGRRGVGVAMADGGPDNGVYTDHD